MQSIFYVSIPDFIYNLSLFVQVPKYLKIHSLVNGLFMVFYMDLYQIGNNVTKLFSVFQGTPVAGVKGGWQGFADSSETSETIMIAGTAPKQWSRFWGGFFPIWEHFFEKTTPNTTPE